MAASRRRRSVRRNSRQTRVPTSLPIIAVHRYYEDPGVQALHHALKEGSHDAAAEMAREMAPFVPPSAVLVPMPGRTGRGGAGLRIAQALSALTGRPVVEALRGRERESLYAAKKRGVDPTHIDLGFRVHGAVPRGQILVIDNVIGTGHTALSALRALPGATVLVHAIDLPTFVRSQRTPRRSSRRAK